MELRRLRRVLSAAAGCPDERWSAWSTWRSDRAVGRLVFRIDVLAVIPFRMNEFCCQAKLKY